MTGPASSQMRDSARGPARGPVRVVVPPDVAALAPLVEAGLCGALEVNALHLFVTLVTEAALHVAPADAAAGTRASDSLPSMPSTDGII